MLSLHVLVFYEVFDENSVRDKEDWDLGDKSEKGLGLGG